MSSEREAPSLRTLPRLWRVDLPQRTIMNTERTSHLFVPELTGSSVSADSFHAATRCLVDVNGTSATTGVGARHILGKVILNYFLYLPDNVRVAFCRTNNQYTRGILLLHTRKMDMRVARDLDWRYVSMIGVQRVSGWAISVRVGANLI